MQIHLPSGKPLNISEGETLFHALKTHGIYLNASCGGKGICGKCLVKIIGGKFRVKSSGKLAPIDIKAGHVLACQTLPEENLIIDIPKESRLTVGDIIEIARSSSRSYFIWVI